MSYAANSTLVTTGMLPVVVLASAALTAPVSLYLLRRYPRAALSAYFALLLAVAIYSLAHSHRSGAGP